jgi:peptidyl-prolyl cis-trans isomerase
MYMRVSKNKFVTVTYDLHVGDADDRTLMERATPEQPLKFIYGIGAMLEAFEKNLSGLEPGDRFEFSLTPEQAYGQRIEENVVDLPKSVFMVDGVFDSERVKEGATLPMMSAEGQHMNGSVLEVKDDVVVMDFNHPLAGETLHFAGQVADVHEPTAEELAEMEQMMHGGGCGGHDHDGCGGCDGCCH